MCYKIKNFSKGRESVMKGERISNQKLLKGERISNERGENQ